MLSVLSYNVHFGKRLDRIIFWLLTQRAYDVICFQEFPKQYIPICVKALAWGNYGYRFAPFLKRRGKLYGELTLFRKEKLSLVSSSTLFLGINSGERVLLRARIPRTSLVTLFRYQRKHIVLVNVHLVNVAFNALRYQQLMKIVKKLGDYHMPSMLVGDFNLSSFFGRRKLFRLMKECGYETYMKRLSTHRISVVRHQMDYVFWKKMNVTTPVVYKRIKFSDHLPFALMLSPKR